MISHTSIKWQKTKRTLKAIKTKRKMCENFKAKQRERGEKEKGGGGRWKLGNNFQQKLGQILRHKTIQQCNNIDS